MSNLRGRLERLERRQGTRRVTFWDLLIGTVSEEDLDTSGTDLDPETRRIFESLCEDGPDVPDEIEEAIRQAELPDPDTSANEPKPSSPDWQDREE